MYVLCRSRGGKKMDQAAKYGHSYCTHFRILHSKQCVLETLVFNATCSRRGVCMYVCVSLSVHERAW